MNEKVCQMDIKVYLVESSPAHITFTTDNVKKENKKVLIFYSKTKLLCNSPTATPHCLTSAFIIIHRDLGSNNITVLRNQSFFMLAMLEEL